MYAHSSLRLSRATCTYVGTDCVHAHGCKVHVHVHVRDQPAILVCMISAGDLTECYDKKDE